jgi:hypothetical protein
MSALTIEWPMTLPSMSNARLHWAARAATVKAQRATTQLSLRANAVGTRLEPLGHGMRLVVTLTRFAARTLDDDNLRGAFKAVRDAVAAYFHLDDADKRIAFEYAQEKAGVSLVRVSFRMEARHSPGRGQQQTKQRRTQRRTGGSTMNPNEPQPLPQAGVGAKTWQLVIADMNERDEMGARKYGVRHQHDNGRDHLVDAYQEALDLCVYLRAEIEKRKGSQ